MLCSPLTLVCLLVAGPLDEELAEPPPAPAAVESDPLRTQVEAALRQLRSHDAPPEAEIAAGISALGPGVFEVLYGILLHRRIPASEEEPEQQLSIFQEEAALLALEGLDQAFVRAELAARLTGERRPVEIVAGLLCLGAVGDESQLTTIFDLAVPAEETPLDPRIEEALEACLERLLIGDPGAYRSLGHMHTVIAPQLVPAVIRAVGQAGDVRGLDFLERVLRSGTGEQLLAVSQVRRLGPSMDPDENRGLARVIRPLLDPEEPGACREAAVALATLEDFDVTPALLELLESEDEGLSSNAHWALQRLTGLSLPANAVMWNDWYDREMAWFAREEFRAIRNLRHSSDGRVAASIRALAERRLYRHRLAPYLCRVLDRHESSLRVMACKAMGELASPVVLEDLVGALGDSNSEVRATAHRALVQITGLDLELDELAWRQVLEDLD